MVLQSYNSGVVLAVLSSFLIMIVGILVWNASLPWVSVANCCVADIRCMIVMQVIAA